MNTKSNLFQELSEDMRVSSVNRHLLVSYEAKLMNAETYVYSICQQIGIPCSKVLYYCLLDSYVGLVSYEAKLMNAETYVYSICQQIGIPCSKVLYYCLLDSYVGYGEYNDRELYENNMRKLRHFLKSK